MNFPGLMFNIEMCLLTNLFELYTFVETKCSTQRLDFVYFKYFEAQIGEISYDFSMSKL